MIAAQLPGRTTTRSRDYWNTHPQEASCAGMGAPTTRRPDARPPAAPRPATWRSGRRPGSRRGAPLPPRRRLVLLLRRRPHGDHHHHLRLLLVGRRREGSQGGGHLPAPVELRHRGLLPPPQDDGGRAAVADARGARRRQEEGGGGDQAGGGAVVSARGAQRRRRRRGLVGDVVGVVQRDGDVRRQLRRRGAGAVPRPVRRLLAVPADRRARRGVPGHGVLKRMKRHVRNDVRIGSDWQAQRSIHLRLAIRLDMRDVCMCIRSRIAYCVGRDS
ncbi:hypothetical protein HU200_013076 [Digitaria exilis]|uniref:Uncharacterized protein n=1 Tax=Digitaria exilis TaxID=1010633 RepID=A0A835FDP3_9POAL|nr:hypothetical protein HU200_013076 [Digitaria exilis]